MSTATYTKSGIQFVVYIKNYDESENDIEYLGVFPTFQDAVDFRKDYLFKTFELDGEDYQDLTDEEFEEEFEAMFGGDFRKWVLDDGHVQFNIDEVPVYTK
jgi:hypothetical protein